MEKKLVTTKEAAKILGISVSYVPQLMQNTAKPVKFYTKSNPKGLHINLYALKDILNKKRERKLNKKIHKKNVQKKYDPTDYTGLSFRGRLCPCGSGVELPTGIWRCDHCKIITDERIDDNYIYEEYSSIESMLQLSETQNTHIDYDKTDPAEKIIKCPKCRRKRYTVLYGCSACGYFNWDY